MFDRTQFMAYRSEFNGVLWFIGFVEQLMVTHARIKRTLPGLWHEARDFQDMTSDPLALQVLR